MARREALNRLNKTLQTRRVELRQRFGADLAGMGDGRHSKVSGDVADAAFESSGEELNSQMAELEAKELNQIEKALKRLKQGSYGLCEGCSCKIPVARLNVLPYSTMCIKCQRASESDSNWLAERRMANWEDVRDTDSGREVRMSDLEMGYIK
jgi:DnaK suppressor protein